jgi:hypothetical protein
MKVMILLWNNAQREEKPQMGKKKFGTKLDEAHNLRRGELS